MKLSIPHPSPIPRTSAEPCKGLAEELSGDGRGRLRPSRVAAGGTEPLAAVAAHVLDQRQQRLALVRQRVLDARRDLGKGVAGDDALILERAQAQRERP